jgi:hypothetical protein
MIAVMRAAAAISYCCGQRWFENYSALDDFWMVSGSLAKLLWIRAVLINESYLCIFCHCAKAIQF